MGLGLEGERMLCFINKKITAKKVAQLWALKELDVLTDSHFKKLRELSSYPNWEVKLLVAELLAHFVNRDSQGILHILANDKENIVRAEAYDTLALFPYPETEELLKERCVTEKDEVARGCAIPSWADVVVARNGESSSKTAFAKQRKASEGGDLCWSYVLYRFGETAELDEMLTYLQNDYFVLRIASMNLMSAIADCDNAPRIEYAVRELLKVEDTLSVTEVAHDFLKYLSKFHDEDTDNPVK